MGKYREQLMCWAVVRLNPGFLHTPVSKFRRRGEAESYLGVLRQQLPLVPYVIVFDQGGWNEQP